MKRHLWWIFALAGAILFFALAFWGENNESSEHSSLSSPSAVTQSVV